jgi:ADP-ribosylarginine hydrolase
MATINDRIRASFVLGSYLDTLGFNNGKWEFNFNNPQIKTLNNAMIISGEIIHNFFAYGGFNINLINWVASDDTIMMLATYRACKKGATEKDFIDEYLKILPDLEDKKRASGITTLQSLRILKKHKKLSSIMYSDIMGGNGAAMRTHYIGIYFKNDIKKTIEVSIMASRLTHNYPLGFLGGMATALFANYAINKIPPWEWVDNMIDLEEKGIIDHIMKKTDIYEKYMKDKDIFWTPWYKFRENRVKRFDMKTSEFIFSVDRYSDLEKILYENDSVDYNRFGATGASSVIIALDSILCSITMKDAGKINLNKPEKIQFNWNSVVFFSTLHFGDNDTIGAIAGALYGAYCGFDEASPDLINMLEYKKEMP